MTVRRWLVLPLLLVAVLTSGCVGFGGMKAADDSTFIQQDRSLVQIGTADREGPRDISGTSLTGEPVSLADYRGKVVVLNVWSSTCNPCIKEMPELVAAAKKLPSVQFVGIDIRDASPENGLSFQNSLGATYPSIFDPSSSTLLSIGRYAPQGPPFTYVLDTQGRVADVFVGGISSSQTLVDVVHDVQAE